MKMRLLALLLAMVCLLTACATPKKEPQTPQVTVKVEPVEAVAILQKFEDPELQRAQALGMIPGDWAEDALNRTITGAEMYEMLTTVVQLSSPDSLQRWEDSASALIHSDTLLYHSDGTLAVYYAACAMDQGQWPNGDWNWQGESRMNTSIGQFNFELFPDAGQDSPFRAHNVGPDNTEWDYCTGANFWSKGQFSRVSGKPVFELPLLPDGVEPHTQQTNMQQEYLSRDTAIRACLRMYESLLEPIVPETVSGEAAAYFEQADQRREAILNSPTTIVKSDTYIQGETYTGKAYYVSNEGNDSNNGLSEETPWATLEKVNNAKLQPGDAVFFRRGDTWYGQVWGKPQVTYSAYGDGQKPRFLGSDPGLSQSENWTEYGKSTDGGTIWTFAKPLADAAGIFYDGGWAEKKTPGWTGEYYCNEDLTPFVVEDALNEDLTYFSALDLAGNPADFETDVSKLRGPLYLRCDAGNPAEVLSELHASMVHTGLAPDEYFGTGVTVDNLAFYYYAGLGVGCAGYQGWKGTHIQNCDFGFCGGELRAYQESHNYGYGAHSCSGAAIQLAGSENNVIDCYIHDCDNKSIAGPIHELGADIPTDYYGLTVKGNLIERSGAFLLANYTSNPQEMGSYTDVLVEDNLVLKTSEAWFLKKLTNVDAYHEGNRLCTMDLTGLNGGRMENVVFRNNVFLGGVRGLIAMDAEDNPRPVFEGNVYGQYENGWAGDIDGSMLAITAEGDRSITAWLGDTTGTVLTIQ